MLLAKTFNRVHISVIVASYKLPASLFINYSTTSFNNDMITFNDNNCESLKISSLFSLFLVVPISLQHARANVTSTDMYVYIYIKHITLIYNQSKQINAKKKEDNSNQIIKKKEQEIPSFCP